MDWLDLVYAMLATLLFFGAKGYGRKQWNDGFLSLEQMKMLQGYMAVCIMFHHMAQKTCAPWHPAKYIVHGLDIYVDLGYFFVGVFLFCSGYGLFKSYKTKENYLKGFVKSRILPIVIAFYASEWIYLILRVLMGEKMDVWQVVYYFTGVQLANYYGWYVIAVPIFYLIFYLAFKFCKKDGWALFMTTIGILLYTWIGTYVDHNDWWMKGEWWYNTAHLFVLGLLFARFEKTIVAHVKKYYWIYLVLMFVGIFAFFKFSVYAQNVWSYYGENFKADHKVLRRWGCLFSQMLTSSSFVFFVFLAMMKIKIGNKALQFFGGITLELYLIHGIFVELFGYNFLDVTESLHYIKNVPLYVLVVVVCAIPATLLFKQLLKLLTFFNGKPKKRNSDVGVKL